MVVETHLMHNVIRHGELVSNCKEQKSAAEGVAVHRDVDVGAGNKRGNKKERDELTQKEKSEMILSSGLEKTGDFEREKNENKGALEDREGQQKTNMSLAQMESEVKDAENEPRMAKQKLRRKKWKLQARNVEGIRAAMKLAFENENGELNGELQNAAKETSAMKLISWNIRELGKNRTFRETQ
ncbi:hypothetical protein WN943_000686 [Citrus x changshan-huyou]